jgi:hypothetical protein
MNEFAENLKEAGYRVKKTAEDTIIATAAWWRLLKWMNQTSQTLNRDIARRELQMLKHIVRSNETINSIRDMSTDEYEAKRDVLLYG